MAHKASLSRLNKLFAGLALCCSSAVFANHPVLVEGDADFDGDGLLGTAEDTDGDDQIFGTIAAALGSANRAANQNGHVIIVTSGRFLEVVTITAANGDVTLQAAPGVEAEIEAVRAGDPDSAGRQNAPGIIVDAPADRRVIIRNIVSRNWTDGIIIQGDSHVLIDNSRFENNRDFNIHVVDNATVTIVNSQVNAAGFRNGANLDNTPNPGIGIGFEDNSSGLIANTTISGNFAAGVSRLSGAPKAVMSSGNIVFDNNPNFDRIAPPR